MPYLDYAAHTPMSSEVRRHLRAAYDSEQGNPHNLGHRQGRQAAKSIEVASVAVSALFGDDSTDVTFTSGATEANNLAILGAANAAGRHCRVLTTSTEHASVTQPCRWLASRGAEVVFIPVDTQGKICWKEFERQLTVDTDLVSILWVNNETGVQQDLPRLGELTRKKSVALHVDATQAVGRVDTSDAREFVDMITLSSHKCGGPCGVGALIGGAGRVLPTIYGGQQQEGLRAGTVPAALASAFGFACELRRSALEAEKDHLERLTRLLRELLTGSGHVISPEDSAPGIICIGFEGLEADTLIAVLDDVAVSTGAACTNGSLETSHVLRAMGTPDSVAMGAIRVSVGAQTTEEDVISGCERILDAVQRLRSSVSPVVTARPSFN